MGKPIFRDRWYRGKTPNLQIRILKSILTSGQLSKKKAASALRANYSDISNSMDALIELKFIKLSETRINPGHNSEKFYNLTESGLRGLLDIKINQDEFWRAIILLCAVSKGGIDDEEFEHYFHKYESNFVGHFNIHGYFFLTFLFDNILGRWQQVNIYLNSVPTRQRVIECLAFHGPSNMHELAKETGVSEVDLVEVLNHYSVQSISSQQKPSNTCADTDGKTDINLDKASKSDFILHLLIATKNNSTGVIYELSLFGLMLMIAIITYHFTSSQKYDRHQQANGNYASYKDQKLFYKHMDLRQCFDTIAINYKDKLPLVFGKWDFLRSHLGLMLYDTFDFLIYKANRSSTIEETIWFSGTKEYYDDIQTLTHNAIKLLYPIHISGITNIGKFERRQSWIANSPRIAPVYRKLTEIGEILKYSEIITALEESKDRGYSRKLLRSRSLYTTDDKEISSIEGIFKDELSFLFYLTLYTNTLPKTYKHSSRPSRSENGKIIIPHEIKEVVQLGGPDKRLMAILARDKDIRNWFSAWIAGIIEYRRQTSERMLEFHDLITNSKKGKREKKLRSNTSAKPAAVYEEYEIKKICIDDFDSNYDYSTI